MTESTSDVNAPGQKPASPQAELSESKADDDSLLVLAAQGPLGVDPNDQFYVTELDPARRLPGGVYLDREQRKEAELVRAAQEGREPDLVNPPATAGTPVRSAAELDNPNNRNVARQVFVADPDNVKKGDLSTTAPSLLDAVQNAKGAGSEEPTEPVENSSVQANIEGSEVGTEHEVETNEVPADDSNPPAHGIKF